MVSKGFSKTFFEGREESEYNRRMATFDRENLGTMVTFLLPSLKLKEPTGRGGTQEDRLHAFLLKEFSGYTASAANLFGYWRSHTGREFYGEHKEYKVSLLDRGRIGILEDFLARIARDMG